MKRFVAPLVVAAVWLGPGARAADPRPLAPTTPQVPAPRMDNGPIVLTSAISSRVIVPIRERVALAIAPSLAPRASTQAVPAPALPLPTGYTPTGGCADGGCATTRRGNCYDRFKAWLCFYPTAGDALPKLRPAPYVGPVAGIFTCTSSGAAGCASSAAGGCAGRGSGGNGCAATGGTGNGDCKGKTGLLGRIGSRGECVPPGDGAFPGYKFATPESRAVGRIAPPDIAPPGTVTSTSYKPAEPITPVQVYPPLTRPLGRQ